MKKETIINPILKKDILVNARSARMVVTITLINCLFALVVGMLFMTSRGSAYQVYYSNIAQMFPVLAVCELCIIGLIVPIITSTSISGERERQTLEIMLTTPVRPISIVAGKLLSAVATTAMYVIATLPFMAVAFIVGGMGWDELFKYLGMVLFIDIYVGSIGIFYSCGRGAAHTKRHWRTGQGAWRRHSGRRGRLCRGNVPAGHKAGTAAHNAACGR